MYIHFVRRHQLLVPCTTSWQFGRRASSVAGAAAWNSLPAAPPGPDDQPRHLQTALIRSPRTRTRSTLGLWASCAVLSSASLHLHI